MSESSSPEEGSLEEASHEEASATKAPDNLDLDALVIPDDISSLVAPANRELAVLLTQVADASALAAASALAGVDVDAAPSPVGALAVLRDPAGDAPERAAAALSTVISGVAIILATRGDGQLTCVRYSGGRAEASLPPGLVLSGAPDALEDLLSGAITVADLPDVVPSVGIGRLKAMRMLTAIARKAKKDQ